MKDSLSYRQWLQKLYALHGMRGMKLGLANSLYLDAALNFPSRKFASIHIAGSNGKGSVSTKIATALQFTGMKVGLYTSPHIASFTERIRIDGKAIAESDLMVLLEGIFAIAEKCNIAATFFELTTLLAFSYFAAQNIDIGVIETGLGGTYDSSNIIEPQLCAISSLSLEHTDLLGTTLSAIAREKAGIIKTATPVVLGPTVPLELIAPYAKARQAPCYCVEGPFADYNSENNGIARRCLELLKVSTPAIEHGLKALPPCRMETIPPPQPQAAWPAALLLDVAHNPDGLKRLFEALRLRHPQLPIRVVFGLSKNKDVAGCLALLKNEASAFHPVAANNPRAMPARELYDGLHAIGIAKEQLFIATTLEENFLLALELATKRRELLIVCGTFFIMAAIRQALGIVEPCDPIDLN